MRHTEQRRAQQQLLIRFILADALELVARTEDIADQVFKLFAEVVICSRQVISRALNGDKRTDIVHCGNIFDTRNKNEIRDALCTVGFFLRAGNDLLLNIIADHRRCDRAQTASRDGSIDITCHLFQIQPHVRDLPEPWDMKAADRLRKMAAFVLVHGDPPIQAAFSSSYSSCKRMSTSFLKTD